jgi:nucleoside-diphosphate-sugar epimerase
LPLPFQNEVELEEFLSRPSPEDCAAAARLESPVLLLGAGGKMGPTLALRIKRARPDLRVVAVSRFSDAALVDRLAAQGVETISLDLLSGDLGLLPDSANVLYLAGRKFGSSGEPWLTWAMNTVLPARVAERFSHARIVALSSGNIYALSEVKSGGPQEDAAPGPVGEYAQSVLGRERVFEYYSQKNETPVLLVRLNYAVEPRYGVLLDVATKVMRGEAVPLAMGFANVIWQGDANSVLVRAFDLCASPAAILNLTGTETISIREVAEGFGRRFGLNVRLEGEEAATALLNNAVRCAQLFGRPTVELEAMMDWTAQWLLAGGGTHNKPTHFESRTGSF